MSEDQKQHENEGTHYAMDMVCWFCERSIAEEKPRFVDTITQGEKHPVAVCEQCYEVSKS